jgi:hypothetical protein
MARYAESGEMHLNFHDKLSTRVKYYWVREEETTDYAAGRFESGLGDWRDRAES